MHKNRPASAPLPSSTCTSSPLPMIATLMCSHLPCALLSMSMCIVPSHCHVGAIASHAVVMYMLLSCRFLAPPHCHVVM